MGMNARVPPVRISPSFTEGGLKRYSGQYVGGQDSDLECDAHPRA
jgi:hypothetical protein